MPDFELPDCRHGVCRLGDLADKRLVVLAFLGIDCPLAKLYAGRLKELANDYRDRGVTIVGINSNAHDTPAAIARFADEHGCQFPILKDADQRLADTLGATRQLEVFLLDEQRQIRYHGRIDDQYGPGTRRPAPLRQDLLLAIDELLEGKPVSMPETEVVGCFLDRAEAGPEGGITYSRHIAPLLARHCVECHRPGQVGPFSLTSYQDAVSWSQTIRERVANGAMPPWHADPRYGHFSNQRRLTADEKQCLYDWIDGGMARGEVTGEAVAANSASQPVQEWRIGPPDKILTVPEPIQVPAHGIVDYITVELDPGFTVDTWIRGTEVRPGNRAVVHHCTVYIGPPSGGDVTKTMQRGLQYFADFVPGLTPTVLPAGMARKIPAGWHVYLQLHYVTNGTATTDQTSFGMTLAKEVRIPVYTGNLLRDNFEIQPYEASKRLEQSWTTTEDVLLLSLFPHMHLRGKSFRYEAVYPDGRQEVLLSVPRFDFMWQHRYILSEPKLLPAGTTLRGLATYDNSAANRNNPDPSATVKCGPQTTDEMFNGYYDFCPLGTRRAPRKHGFAVAAVLLGSILWIIKKRRLTKVG